MTQFPILSHAIAAALLVTAGLIDSGCWCFWCHAAATDECCEGTCQAVEQDGPFVDHEAFRHVPDVDFGGGD